MLLRLPNKEFGYKTVRKLLRILHLTKLCLRLKWQPYGLWKSYQIKQNKPYLKKLARLYIVLEAKNLVVVVIERFYSQRNELKDAKILNPYAGTDIINVKDKVVFVKLAKQVTIGNIQPVHMSNSEFVY